MGFYPEQAPTPWRSNEERLTTQALAVANVPGSLIREMRPPSARTPLFPPRFGYVQKAIGIDEVLGVDRYYPNYLPDFSGGPAGWQGAARNVEGTW